MKVRLQVQGGSSTPQVFSGPLDCTLQTIRKEGFIGLYKGMVSPMTTVPLVNAVVFSTYESAKSFFLSKKDQSQPQVLTNYEAMMAGKGQPLLKRSILKHIIYDKTFCRCLGWAGEFCRCNPS